MTDICRMKQVEVFLLLFTWNLGAFLNMTVCSSFSLLLCPESCIMSLRSSEIPTLN